MYQKFIAVSLALTLVGVGGTVAAADEGAGPIVDYDEGAGPIVDYDEGAGPILA